jgi:ADP-L-glycero-D-manno-heptose 6-epimerase
MDNNFFYSKKLLDFALEKNARFIYASSAATYGDGNSGYSDKSIDNLIPMNPYGFSKHLFDMYVMNNGLENKVTGIKYFNVFGPNEYHKGNMRSMFLKSFEQIKATSKVNLFKSNDDKYKDGEQKRDFIYVKDCSKIVLKMLKDNNFTGIYNVGTGKAET